MAYPSLLWRHIYDNANNLYPEQFWQERKMCEEINNLFIYLQGFSFVQGS